MKGRAKKYTLVGLPFPYRREKIFCFQITQAEKASKDLQENAVKEEKETGVSGE